MGNCISKINKDNFFAVEELIKMTFCFQSEREGLPLTGLPVGRIRGSIP